MPSTDKAADFFALTEIETLPGNIAGIEFS